MLNREALEIIEQWIYYNEKLKDVNKYLFEHTELYEQKYMTDYREDVFRFFAGKITRFGRDYNTLYKILTNEESKEIQKIKMMKR